MSDVSLKRLMFCEGRTVVVRARRTVDISLGSSVVEHLSSSAEVLASIPGPAIHYRLCFFLSLIDCVFHCICPFRLSLLLFFVNSCTHIENI